MRREVRAVLKGTASASDLLTIMHTDLAFAHGSETLLSSLALMNNTGLPRSIMFCSSQPGEGKTTLATMLALTAAKAEKRVLLVDADLRRPRIHKIFGVDNRCGLGEFLAGEVSVQDSISFQRVTSTESPTEVHLGVMSSGTRHSAGFNQIERTRFTDAVGEMTAMFDFVIIDCPPVLAVSDALFLAPAVEGVVFTVDAGAVSSKEAKLAKSRLEKTGARLLGFVMNRLDEKGGGVAYHPYHNSYCVPAP